MLSLKEIQKPVQENLDYFNNYLKECVKNDRLFVEDILKYLLKNQGKQMRPLLVFLTSGLHGGITQMSYVSAMLIELVHTASLVHDDVVDEAFQRRGSFSVRALWRSRVAVLIGDYIFSRGLKIAVEHRAYEVLGIVSNTMEQMSQGELIQSEVAHKFKTSEADYFEIIHCKTATLISSCSCAGALAGGASAQQYQTMLKFGELLGLAFQIKDDILDYTTTSALGKIACNDLKEQKMTLPLIYVMQKADERQRKEIIKRLKAVDKDSGANIEWLRRQVIDQGGITYAQKRMEELHDQAIALLNSYPESIYKESLTLFANYVLSRKN